MNYSRIIAIDLDGTVIDCYPRQAAVTEYIFRQLGISNIDFHFIWKHKRAGLSTIEVLNSCFPEINTKISYFFDKWLELIEESYWLTFDRLFPWSLPALETLNSMGFRLVLLTARQRPESILDFLKRNKLNRLFYQTHVVSPQKATEQKADLLLQVSPLCHCGDTEVDALAAERANVKFIGVSCGQRSREFLERYNSMVVLDNISELPRFLVKFDHYL